ncbi:MAG: helicase [Deltaproteobacteria bacterium RIFOXYD12_FULL_50_9]|nr:MAG: helicase [Deltaproteobacteria bacterium RIFOXYD12_FULL_50_9]
MNSSDLQATLTRYFDLQTFRPGQSEVITALLRDGKALAVFPTGGGKSLCYQLTSLLLDGVTIVISPLIALMKDQIDALRQLGIQATRLDSTLSAAEASEVSRQLTSGAVKLLYVAPERFNNERFLDQLGRTQISLFAIDEAHCISEWGHNFRPDYLKLAENARALRVERILTLTATATPQVIQDICASFGIPEHCAIVTGFQRPNLQLLFNPTPLANRTASLITRIHQQLPGSGIVYVTLQKTAETVAAALAAAGIQARAYHAGMTDDERSAVQEWWKESNQALVVATIAFGMGVDKADVRYIYHYNLAKSLESYSQEIGRAGRDGRPALVETLGSLEDRTVLENFAYGDTPEQRALTSLLADILGQEQQFSVALFNLSAKHDIRPLVLRTALTYLELNGVLKQGTPYYAGYRAKLLEPVEAIASRFKGERVKFVRELFAHAKQGRTWFSFDVDEIAKALGEERMRLVRALEYFNEQGWLELQASEARQRYTRLLEQPDIAELTEDLYRRFLAREKREIERIGLVVGLVEQPACQAGALLRYFGEQEISDCGRCSYCQTRMPVAFPPLPSRPLLEQALDWQTFVALSQNTPDALGSTRQRARFLCGLTSPALTRTKLTRHLLFGALAEHPFQEVLNHCKSVFISANS